jgi:RNA polymerase sigma factor (sigma-70 family)
MDEHFFRHESGRLVAALTRVFGVHNLQLAEDVVQDAFGRALEHWKTSGVPDNPSAWLMTTARNAAIDILRRERTARTFAPELGRLLETEWTLTPVVEEAFAAGTIRDEQLRMMFSCCHPRLAVQAQLALVLNILCGFGAAEIAAAFLEGRAAVEKRIARGKRSLASARRLFDLRDAELAARLDTVRRALYLLFNEGYHGASAQTPVRAELCAEAIRLVRLLTESEAAATPTTFALTALMCLHAARLPARIDGSGELAVFADQDRGKWDARLVAEGLAALERSAAGDEVTAWHIEAAIAAVHASATSMAATDWATIVALYDRLAAIAPSPVVSLNRAVAVAERDGAEAGIAAIEAIASADRARLATYPFLEAALGELERRRGRASAARAYFEAAEKKARNAAERRFLRQRVGG